MTIETILPTPNIFDAWHVLCIQAHYDDNDIAAGESFARCEPLKILHTSALYWGF